MASQYKKRLFCVRWVTVLFACALIFSSIPASHAQNDARFFPESGHYVRGLFRQFWEQNGNVYIFGYPITEEYTNTETGLPAQYFERARFELRQDHNGQLYVHLANLGQEITAGRTFSKAQPILDASQKRYIPQTQYIIKYGFKQIWETYGAQNIFGLPISNEMDETLPDGNVRTVQYFEKARFEYWPELPPGQRVIISALGRLLVPSHLVSPGGGGGGQAASAQASAQGGSGSNPGDMPDDVNASVTPKMGMPGTEFKFQATEFQPNELVSVWLTGPDKTVRELEQVKANDRGRVGDKLKAIRSSDMQTGVWTVTAQGIDSGKQAFAHFYVGAPSNAPSQSTAPPPAPAPGSPAQGQSVEGIPAPIQECSNNAPSPTEGIQAWMEKTAVEANKDDSNRLCTRLIIGGKVVAGLEARGVVHFDDGDVWIGPEKTREEDGVASIKFDVDKKEAGVTVKVNAEIIYNGQSYYAETAFTPQ